MEFGLAIERYFLMRNPDKDDPVKWILVYYWPKD
jgi:hypothetical protein